MKKIVQIASLCLLIMVVAASCKKTTKGLRPPVTGKSGELLVLVNDALWKGAVGDSLKAILNEPQIGLPQNEPLFNVLHITHNSFSSMFKTHRSILDIRVSAKVKKDRMYVKDEVYAKTQSFMKLEASTKEGMLKLLQENRNKIGAYFLLGERNRKIKVFQKNLVQDIFEKLKSKYGFTLSFPAGYVVNKEDDNFLWISNETPKTSQGMFIYSYDYTTQDLFTKEAVLEKRNFLLRKYIPGPKEGSYMTTESEFPVSFRQFKFHEHYAYETRGLWKVENDFMGGPFVSITFLDEENNRIICMDSYVYYPNHNKREMLRELEAIMFSYNKLDKKK